MQAGAELRSKHGKIFKFVEYDPAYHYPYFIEDEDGGLCSRTIEGWVYAKRWLPEDHDIVEILPVGE
jgi:hypothetical protein